MPSFDVVSRVDFQEIDNAIANALREITNRYDFKGSNTSVERKEKIITIVTDDDLKLSQVVDILISHFVRRKLDPLALGKKDKEKAGGDRIRQTITLVEGIEQDIAKKISNEKYLNILCGHFEGVDQRVLDNRNIEEISIGDYIISGGETASYIVLDSVLRLLPGVLGNKDSIVNESFENGLLEYPQYTKPQIWEEKTVPDVLLSGDHAKIKDWRLSQSEAITRDRRPDLWQKYKRFKKN